MKTIKILLALTLAVSLVSCQKQMAQEAPEKEQHVQVKTAQAELRNYAPELVYSGTAFANREANLGASLPGRVEKFYFTEGDNVKKGQLLVELSAELLTQALAENNAIEKDYNRVKRLKEKGSVSEQTYDHVSAKLKASNAKVEQLSKNAKIHAPFAGTVVDKLMEEGENYLINFSFEPGYSHTSGILRLMQLDPLKVKIEVNEKEIRFIKKGQSANIHFDAYPGESFEGTIKNIKPMLSTMSRTATVEISVPNKNHRIKPGMFSNVNIVLNEKPGIFVPANAIYRMPGTGLDYVYAMQKNQTVKRIAVKKISIHGDDVLIEGIQPGISIVTHGKHKVQDGMKVLVQK